MNLTELIKIIETHGIIDSSGRSEDRTTEALDLLRQIRDRTEKAHRHTGESVGPQVMPKIGGKHFHCDCGGNVFTKLDDNRYRCNGCRSEYEGVSVEKSLSSVEAWIDACVEHDCEDRRSGRMAIPQRSTLFPEDNEESFGYRCSCGVRFWISRELYQKTFDDLSENRRKLLAGVMQTEEGRRRLGDAMVKR